MSLVEPLDVKAGLQPRAFRGPAPGMCVERVGSARTLLS